MSKEEGEVEYLFELIPGPSCSNSRKNSGNISCHESPRLSRYIDEMITRPVTKKNFVSLFYALSLPSPSHLEFINELRRRKEEKNTQFTSKNSKQGQKFSILEKENKDANLQAFKKTSPFSGGETAQITENEKIEENKKDEFEFVKIRPYSTFSEEEEGDTINKFEFEEIAPYSFFTKNQEESIKKVEQEGPHFSTFSKSEPKSNDLEIIDIIHSGSNSSQLNRSAAFFENDEKGEKRKLSLEEDGFYLTTLKILESESERALHSLEKAGRVKNLRDLWGRLPSEKLPVVTEDMIWSPERNFKKFRTSEEEIESSEEEIEEEEDFEILDIQDDSDAEDELVEDKNEMSNELTDEFHQFTFNLDDAKREPEDSFSLEALKMDTNNDDDDLDMMTEFFLAHEGQLEFDFEKEKELVDPFPQFFHKMCAF